MTPQQLAEGVSEQARLEKIYGSRLKPIKGDNVKDAAHSSFMFFARVNAGKTYFLLSRSDLALVNLDLSPTTRPNAQALCWPPLDISPPATWADVHDFIGKACTDPNINAIGMDSLNRAIGMARKHAAYTYYKRKCVRQQVPAADIKTYDQFDHYDIRFQDGLTVWDLTYDAIVLEMARVQQAGKGFILTGHLDLQRRELPDGGYEEVEGATATANCLRRLLHAMDGVFVIRKLSESVAAPLVAVTGDKPTTPRRARRPAMVKVTKQYVVTKGLPSNIQDYLVKGRTRSSLPDRIDITGGWSDFATVYNAAT